MKQWHLNDNSLIRTFEGHLKDVNCVTLSSDDRFLFSGSDDMLIIQWNINNGTIEQKFEGHSNLIRSIALS